MRAVADRAGVNERTVYRHFTNERGLRDAVMHRLEEQAGIDLDDAAPRGHRRRGPRIFASVSAHRSPAARRSTRRSARPASASARPCSGRWAHRHRVDRGRPAVAAAMFDVLWGVAPYERLVADWGLDPEQAVAGITWVIGLIEEAVRDGRGPGHARDGELV